MLSASLIYPIVSLHGLTLPSAALFLADAAAMGGVCWRGLWVKVCLSGPAERNEEKTLNKMAHEDGKKKEKKMCDFTSVTSDN